MDPSVLQWLIDSRHSAKVIMAGTFLDGGSIQVLLANEITGPHLELLIDYQMFSSTKGRLYVRLLHPPKVRPLELVPLGSEVIPAAMMVLEECLLCQEETLMGDEVDEELLDDINLAIGELKRLSSAKASLFRIIV